MYCKNPNHANKFRRIFNKKYPPGNRCVVYSAISAGCIGSPAAVASGIPPGLPVRAVGPDEKTVRRCSAMVRVLRKSGSGRARRPTESISEYSGHPPVGAFRNIRDPLRVWTFGMFGDSPGEVVRDVWRFSGRGRSGRSETLLSGRSGCSEALLSDRSGCSETLRAGSFETFGGSSDWVVRVRSVRSVRSLTVRLLTVRTRTGLLRAAVT